MPPWWNAGLPFACSRCGKCCHARDGYDKVYLGPREERALARHLGLGAREFRESFTVRDRLGYRTLRFRGGRCVFLRGAECTVHAAKPVQCQTWPFWPELLRSERAYAREVRSFCPGSRDGDFVPAAEIRRQLRALAAAEADADAQSAEG